MNKLLKTICGVLKRDDVFLIIITFIGTVFRLFMSTTTWGYLSPDEARYLKLALSFIVKDPSETAAFRPGLPLILFAVMMIVGSKTSFVGHFVSQVFGISLIPLSYFLGKNLRTSRSGKIAAILFATSGMFIHHSSRILTDAPAIFFSLFALLLFTKGFSQEKKILGYFYSFFGGITVILAISIRVSAIIFFLCLFVFFLLRCYNSKNEAHQLLPHFVLGIAAFMIIFLYLTLIPGLLQESMLAILLNYFLGFIKGVSPSQLVWNIGVSGLRILGTLSLTITSYFFENIFFFCLAIISSIAIHDSYKRRGRSDQILLIWIALYLIMYIFAENVVLWEDWRYLIPVISPSLFLISFSVDSRYPSLEKLYTRIQTNWLALKEKVASINLGSMGWLFLCILIALLIIIPLNWIFASTLTILCICLYDIKSRKSISVWTPFLLIGFLIMSSNFTIITSANVLSHENTVEYWEVYRPNTIIPISNNTDDINTLSLGITEFALPKINYPGPNVLSKESLFIWTKSNSSYEILVVAWNNTEEQLTGQTRIRGYNIVDIRMSSQFGHTENSSFSIRETGYFSFIDFNIEATSSLMAAEILLLPIRTSDSHRIEIDVFETSLRTLWSGSVEFQLPYTLTAKWLELYMLWNISIQSEMEIDISINSLELECIINESELTDLDIISISAYSSNIRILSNITNGFAIIYLNPITEAVPDVDIAFSVNGEISNILVGSEIYSGIFNLEFLHLDNLYTSLLPYVGTLDILLITFCIGVSVFVFKMSLRRKNNTALSRCIILSALISGLSIFLSGSFLDATGIIFLQEEYALLFMAAISIRMTILFGGAITLLIILYQDLLESSYQMPLEYNTISSIIEKIKSLQFFYRSNHFRSNLILLVLLVMIFSGPAAAFEFSMETRETYDSMMKCGYFLESTFSEKLNVLTNENGPWYIEWFSRHELNVSSIPLHVIEETTNLTSLVVNMILDNNIHLVIVFERLSYSLTEIYLMLHELGYLTLIRDYHEQNGWNTLIYEVNSSFV